MARDQYKTRKRLVRKQGPEAPGLARLLSLLREASPPPNDLIHPICLVIPCLRHQNEIGLEE